MTLIALLADLHFGSVPPGLAEQLRQDIIRLAPDLIVIAGDLTMQSRPREFEEARRWIDSLCAPFLVLPGNHDLPVWNVFERMWTPFARYCSFIERPLMPVYEDDAAIVLGLNTTSNWQPGLRWQEGVARRGDVRKARERLGQACREKARIVFTHHPLVAVDGMPSVRPVRRAAGALGAFAEQGVDILMSGHIHRTFAVKVGKGAGSMIAVGAPTSLSTRLRGEPNGFWLVSARPDALRLTLHSFDGASFAPRPEPIRFAREEAGAAYVRELGTA